ncbi:MAG: putative glycoside hydrolase [Oscillospiraceae bacterium]|nr:putative glycoside hydrolase [Oscillospiraceae bacterium]
MAKRKKTPAHLRKPVWVLDNENSQSGDFQDIVIGSRRGRRLRRALKVFFSAAGIALTLAAGFFATETLVRISELPPRAEIAATEEQTTDPDSAAAPPKPAAPSVQADLRAIYAPLTNFDFGSIENTRALIKQARDSGANAVAILFKDSEGLLGYRSHLIQQSLLNASGRATGKMEKRALEILAAQLRLVAVVDCFADPLAANAMPESAVLQKDTENVPWKDAQGRAWLNPYAESAREYLLGILRELAQIGVTDIVLDSVRFPGGNLQAAVFPGEPKPDDPEARNAALLDFLVQAREAAGEARVFCVMPAKAALEGAEEYGGDLWGSAADFIAVDTRDAAWARDADWGQGRKYIQIISAEEEIDSSGDYIIGDYIIIEEELV